MGQALAIGNCESRSHFRKELLIASDAFAICSTPAPALELFADSAATPVAACMRDEHYDRKPPHPAHLTSQAAAEETSTPRASKPAVRRVRVASPWRTKFSIFALCSPVTSSGIAGRTIGIGEASSQTELRSTLRTSPH